MRNICLFLILICQFNFVHAQETEKLKAKINLSQKDIFVVIGAVVENSNYIYESELNYHLISLKKESNSKAYTKEERFGIFTLLPNERKNIASLKLNVMPDQQLRVYLFIKNGKLLIAQDSVKTNETIKVYKTTAIQEDDIEIKGLMVENVKTKIGKDFYDIFYQKYSQSSTKYSFVININEKPLIGSRGALVSIEVGDDKIFEFQARPDEEFLQKASDYTLKLIESYSKTRNTYEKIY